MQRMSQSDQTKDAGSISPQHEPKHEGILLVDKPAGITSFTVVAKLRRRLGVKKIGHAGTLDPFATGLLVMLVGRNFTKLADSFLKDDKEYQATLLLGTATDTYDNEGEVTQTSSYVPDEKEIQKAIAQFQGQIEQVPPMFSAKKVGGKRLYELARKGQEIERKACSCHVTITLIRYAYPEVDIHVTCSKGTYIRSLAHDIGLKLGTFAHLTALRRLRSGKFLLAEGDTLEKILDPATLLKFLHADL
jgi:tRNA pseudouridine55 synthase